MSYLEGIVTMVGHIAWPATAIAIALIARKELQNIFASLAKRIGDKDSNFSLTKEGLEIRVNAQEARLTSVLAEQDQIKSIALQFPEGITSAPIGTKEIDKPLEEMANEYLVINTTDYPDYSERVMAKNAVADKMAFYVISKGISKDKLAQASNKDNEGLLIALAGSIILYSHTGDDKRLLQAARGAKRFHVRFRVLLAIIKLAERKLLPKSDPGVTQLLEEYEDGDDKPLKRLISNVKSFLEEQ
ncbi:MAG: hypothetical protein U1F70_02080 [Candidatus Competibacteraceae bacterium]